MTLLNDRAPIDASSDTGTTLTVDYNSFRAAFLSSHSNPTAPSYAVSGTVWMSTESGKRGLKYKDGTDWWQLVRIEKDGKINMNLIKAGTANAPGVVRLSDSITAGDTDIAANLAGLKKAYDLASDANQLAGGKANAQHTHSADDVDSGTFNVDRIPKAVPGTAATAQPGAVRLVWDATNKVLDIRVD